MMKGMPRWMPNAMRWAFVVAISACAGGAMEARTAVDDAAVYRAALLPKPDDGIVLRRVVQQTTEPTLEDLGGIAERLAMHARQLPGLDTSTVRSFVAFNGQVAVVPELGDSTLSWVSKKEWRSLFDGEDGGSEFFSRHPDSGGVTLLSRVGYSRDGTQALVYVVRACPLCGEGEYVLLVRANGQWRVWARANDWNS
jgi:hypothetical protein